MGIKPLYDRVLIKPDEPIKRTKGGIYLPDLTQGKPENKPLRGTVLAVGPGGPDTHGNMIKAERKAGEIVHYSQWAGGELVYKGTTYLLVRHTDILGVEGAEGDGYEPPPEDVKDDAHAKMYSGVANGD